MYDERQGERQLKALVARAAKDFVIEEVPEPVIKADEVLLTPLYAGICFTDKHAYEGAPAVPVGPGGLPPGIYGHEWGGRVVEVGPDVTTVKVGDRVASGMSDGCGICLECRSGLLFCANGQQAGLGQGFAELAVLSDTSCWKVHDSVTDLQTGYIEPLAMGTRAARLSGVTVGDNVVFLGLQDYNMSAFQWIRSFAGKILVADPSPARKAMVESLGGATDIIDPNVTDPIARAKDLMPWGADVVFAACEEYVPRSFQYLSDAIHIARRNGVVVANGHEGREERGAPIANWIGVSAYNKEIKIAGFGAPFASEPIVGGRARGDYQRAIDGCANGNVCGPEWKPTVIPFANVTSKSDVDEIFQMLPNQAAKVLFRISGE
jgi:threonine dehydrogenase-like Zn-dependent dehydrogenase